MPDQSLGGGAVSAIQDYLVKQAALRQQTLMNQLAQQREARLAAMEDAQTKREDEAAKFNEQKRTFDLLTGQPASVQRQALGVDEATTGMAPLSPGMTPSVPSLSMAPSEGGNDTPAMATAPTMAALPGQSYQPFQGGETKPMLVGGVRLAPPSMEGQRTAARQKALEDVMTKAYTPKPGEKVIVPAFGTIADGGPEKTPHVVYVDALTKHMTDGETGQTITEAPPNAHFVEVQHPPQRDPAVAEARDLARLDRSYYNSTAELTKLRAPIASQAERIDRVVTSINQNSPQADSLIAPELLTAMAGGQGSGLRMNEAEIARIIGGRTKWESLKSALNQYQLDPTKGLSITPAQRLQIRGLVGEMQKKLNDRLSALDEADTKLREADTVDAHRAVLGDARKAMTASTNTPLAPTQGTEREIAGYPGTAERFDGKNWIRIR